MKRNHETAGRLVEFDPEADVIVFQGFLRGGAEGAEILRCWAVAQDCKRLDAKRLLRIRWVRQNTSRSGVAGPEKCRPEGSENRRENQTSHAEQQTGPGPAPRGWFLLAVGAKRLLALFHSLQVGQHVGHRR